MDVVCGCLGEFLFQIFCRAACEWCCKNNCNILCCPCDDQSCEWCNQHCDNACSRLEHSCQSCNCSRVLEYCFCLPCCDYMYQRCDQTNCCNHCLYSDCCFPDDSEPKFVTARPLHGNYETMATRNEGSLVAVQPTSSRMHVNYEATSKRKDGVLYPSPSTASNLMILSADALEENYETTKNEAIRQSNEIEIITTKENISSDGRRNGSHVITSTNHNDNKNDNEEEQKQNVYIKPKYKQTTV